MSLGNYLKGNYTSNLYEINVEDSTIRLALDSPIETRYLSPNYSPDGQEITFLSLYGQLGHEQNFICTVGRDGSDLKKIADAEFRSYPVWSPKGDKIAYTKQDGIYIVNADGTDNMLLFKGYVDRFLWLP
jgi:Tol biopolymer transport system component